MTTQPSPARMRKVILAACSVIVLMGITVMVLTWNTTILRCNSERCEIEKITIAGASHQVVLRSDVLGADLERESDAPGVPAVRVVLKTTRGNLPLRENFSSLSPSQDRRAADNVAMFLKKGGAFSSKYNNPIGFALGAVATLLGLGVALVVAKMMKG